MSIKRRGFVRSLLIAPAAPALLAAQQLNTQPQTTPKTTPQQPVPQANTPAVQNPRQPPQIPTLQLTELDVPAETYPHYFSTDQFAALQKLASLLMPPMKGNPGALDAHAPEFLDFLISVSPQVRQKSYRDGLDRLNAEAQRRFSKPFSGVDSGQADEIIRPLLAIRLWPEDLPTDPMQSFIAQAHEDIRTATVNSREWAAVSANSGRRFTRGYRGRGMYWKPIDPISEG